MVLKNPLNTGRIPMLLEIFPDARFVFLIRNPLELYLSSVKFFTELFPTLNLQGFPQREIREMVLNILDRLLRDYLKARQFIPAANRIEIRFEDLESRPLQQTRSLYRHFRMPFDGLEPLLMEYLESKQDHSRNGYRIDRQELDAVLHRLQFAMREWHYDLPAGLQVPEPEQIEKA